jgi:signal transduction histidine kinase
MKNRLRVPTGTPTYLAAGGVLAAAAMLEASSADGDRATLSVLNVVVAGAIGVAVVVARWSPPAGLMVLLGSLVATLPLTDLPPVGGTHLIATMLLVGLAAYRQTRLVALGCYVLAVVVPAAVIVASGESSWEFPFFALLLAPAWAVGSLLQREQQRSAELVRLTEELQAERDKQAAVAVAAERTRISRELHDAVAHTVSVMTLQVGVVRRRLAEDSVEGQTLRGAETLGRQAVDELRRIVGLVREGEAAALAPLPSLSQLEDLVAQVRTTGADVELHVSGELDDVPQAVDMSAYRIVQEALTNALRHAPGSRVRVVVTVDVSEVRVEVVNGVASAAPGAVASTTGGNGVAGMRERAAVLGGRLDAGATPDGGFAVRAELPRAVPATGSARAGVRG